MRSHALLYLLLLGTLTFPAISQSTVSFEIFNDPTRFGLSSSQSLNASLTGDFNGDGKPDILATNYDYPAKVQSILFIPGNGDGTFQSAIAAYSESVTEETPILAVDLNKDGALDIVSLAQPPNSTYASELHVFLGKGDGTFSAPVSVPGELQNQATVAAGDLNGDGLPDLVVGNGSTSSSLQIFTNAGGGNFSLTKTLASPSNNPVYSLQVADVDEDGHADIIVGSTNTVGVLWGQDNNSYTPAILRTYTGPQATETIATVGDLNQDGAPDILVNYSCSTQPQGAGKGPGTNTCTGVDVFYGGQGSQKTFYRNAFTDNTLNLLNRVLAIDVDGDGIADIVGSGIDNTAQDGLFVWLGHPDGSFEQTQQRFIVATEYAFNILAADFNRDGKMDFMTPTAGGMYLNATPTAACATSAINPTVVVCQPVDNTYIPASALTIQATTYDKTTVTALQEYVDGDLKYSEDVSSLNLPLTEPVGEHLLVTKAWDASGVQFQSDRHVFVYNGTPGAVCTAPLNGAAICLPGDNTNGTVHIVANGSTQAVPTSAQLYVDGSLVTDDTTHSSAIDTRLTLGSGSHALVFKLWDANGNVSTAQTTVTQN